MAAGPRTPVPCARTPAPGKEIRFMAFSIRTLDGGDVQLPSSELDRLRASLSGDDGQRSQFALRTIWNAMIDRRPALIVRCPNADDVVRAVRFARAHGCCSPSAAAATTSPATRSATAG